MEKEQADWIGRDAAMQARRMDDIHPYWWSVAIQHVSQRQVRTPQEQVYRASYLFEISRRMDDMLCEAHGGFFPVMEAGTLVFPGNDPYAPDPDLPELAELEGHAHTLLLRCGDVLIHHCGPESAEAEG